jgi:Asp-tRNA(Asn)/Glu-tRNA(Gln) amidotransferase A subunit family amidase
MPVAPEVLTLSDLDRRAFVAYFASAGLTSTLLPGTLWAQIKPGTRTITVEMVREAARLAGLDWTDAECQDLVTSLSSLAANLDRIDKPALSNASPLPFHFNPRPPGVALDLPKSSGVRLAPPTRVLRPTRIEDVAFFPVRQLSELVRTRQVSSVDLTRMYLSRLTRHNAALNCVASLTEERALREAAAADTEIDAGKYRGPLHGVPYGVKDIIAARGYPTRWGAAPLERQTFDADATVVERLHEAGAVLVAKLTTGELAFGDQWSGGRTNNPWNLSEGSSGSSAGSGAATAAGLVGFAIGSDTGGSILSPAVRCGVVGLRPTFGRVSRHGVMSAGTTLDKIGPLCRRAEDCAAVLGAIAGPDGHDLAVPEQVPFSWDAARTRRPTRIGYVPAMLEAEKDPDARANNVRALDMLKRLGCTMHEVSLPSGDLSYFIEYVERAAAFDSLTRDGLHRGVRQRTGQYLRACQLVTAVDYLQANRRRLAIMADVAKVMATVDAVLFTTLTLDSATSLNPVMSLTGHPSIAVPNGFNAGGSPAGVMFSGHLYREGELITLASAYQALTRDDQKQPPLFSVAG